MLTPDALILKHLLDLAPLHEILLLVSYVAGSSTHPGHEEEVHAYPDVCH